MSGGRFSKFRSGVSFWPRSVGCRRLGLGSVGPPAANTALQRLVRKLSAYAIEIRSVRHRVHPRAFGFAAAGWDNAPAPAVRSGTRSGPQVTFLRPRRKVSKRDQMSPE